MHEVGAGWLMTTLNSSPAIVSLVQAATTLPIFLFALFAGALADRVDKKRLLILVNVMLTIVVALLAVLVQLQMMTPLLLILFTFAIGTGAAFVAPAWQSIVPSLVPKDHLQPAIALNSMGINISRAIGPALAGFLITVAGVAAPFALNALSHVVIVIALLFWKAPEAKTDRLPPEPIFSAMITGLRHAAYNPALKATLVRAVSFFVFASAYWALLPLIARSIPGGGAELYGLLLGAVGTGAVLGAVLLPTLRKTFDSNSVALAGSAGTALAMCLLALVQSDWTAIAAAFVSGLSWIAVLTSFNVSAQTALPNWVRARGLAIFLMVFFGSMATGATVWGQVAENTSIQIALILATIGLLLAIPLSWRHKLGQGDEMNLAPSMHWAAPDIASDLDSDMDRGPVLVTIEYEVRPEDQSDFLTAIRTLSEERYRDGAFEWDVFQNTEMPNLWVERFSVSSWAEHLRQHDRVTEHDRDIQDQVQRFHVGKTPPKVSHFLPPKDGDG